MTRMALITLAALALAACQDATQPDAVVTTDPPAPRLAGETCVDPPSGLVSWWPGDVDADDIHGTNDGVLTAGAAAGVTGKVAGAFSFDGLDDYVDLSAHTSSLNFSPSATVDFWVQSTSDVAQAIFAMGDGTINNVLVIGIGPFTGGIADPLITVGRKAGGLTPYILSYATPSRSELFDGSFHHVAITFDGSAKALNIYLDGDAKPVSVVTGNFDIGVYGGISGASKTYIGADDVSGPVNLFEGLIDELELFDRALSAGEIADIFNAGSVGKCKPGTHTADADGPYFADEGTAVAFDASGSFDPEGEALTYDWDFGDPLDATGGIGLAPSHTYADDGVFNVTLTVTDPSGSTDTDVTTATISNVLPTVELGPDVTILAGETFGRSGSFTDPGTDSWTAQVGYDDGGGFETLTLAGKSFELFHTYANPGVRSVEVRVFDDDGFGSNVVTVSVVSLQEATQSIIDDVQALVDDGALTENDVRGLVRKLEQAIRKLDQGKDASASSKLQEFVVQVSDFIAAGKLTAAEGQPLIDAAQAIIDSLGG